MVRVWSPGRVNLIGDHTDYLGGLVLPCAIQLGITFDVSAHPGAISLTSSESPTPLVVPLPCDAPASVEPAWGRYVAGVATTLESTTGIEGSLTSTLPAGAGVSSSAALAVGTAISLLVADGATRWDPTEVALVAQSAEHIATAMPCGLMDQLAIAHGQAGAFLRIDCSDNLTTAVSIGDSLDLWLVHSGQSRQLVGSEYATRRAECELAETIIGPLRTATPSMLDDLVAGALGASGELDESTASTLRRRARHVISENARVDAAVDALAHDDATLLGTLLVDGHRSLADDFDTSTPVVDALIDHLVATPGVFGARMTGAGFGGCVVVACEPGVDPTPDGLTGWKIEPSEGAGLR